MAGVSFKTWNCCYHTDGMNLHKQSTYPPLEKLNENFCNHGNMHEPSHRLKMEVHYLT